jgi:hypothetical protein
MKTLFMLTLAFTTLFAITPRAVASSFKRVPYSNYCFDYSKHVVPIAYTAAENAVELFNKVKLNPRVPMKGGGYYLDVPLDRTVFEDFEVNIEFTLNSAVNLSRHLMIFFDRNEPNQRDFFAY